MNDPILELVLAGYIQAMQWASTDGDDNSLEDYELSEEAKENCRQACVNLLDKHRSLVVTVVCEDTGTYNYDNVGHDLFLTREGHGAGFWDRGLGMNGDLLTDYCNEIGTADPYVGDDNLIYLSV